MLIKHRKTFYFISSALSVAALVCIIVFGLNFGIDFTGGSVLSLQYVHQTPSQEQAMQALKDLDLGQIDLQKSGSFGLILKTKTMSEPMHQQVSSRLAGLGLVVDGSESFNSIGPMIGKELQAKTKVVVVLSLLVILIYIALAFRKISRPVKSYIYGITSIIALCHDVLIPLGVMAVLGHYYGAEITIPIITAFLTVFGYSINDSVVVFDRVRENLIKSRTTDFGQIIDQSIMQTMARSLNTTLTTVLSLFAILFLGGETLRYFALCLIIGITLGAYSSIFLATPLTFTYDKFRKRKRA